MVFADTTLEMHTLISKLLVTLLSLLTQLLLFKLQLLSSQSLSQLRLINLFSVNTRQVFSTALLAALLLTTPFSLLVMVLKAVKIIGLLRIHGVLHGVKQDTSKLLQSMVKVFVVFRWLPSIQLLHEDCRGLSNYFSKNFKNLI